MTMLLIIELSKPHGRERLVSRTRTLGRLPFLEKAAAWIFGPIAAEVDSAERNLLLPCWLCCSSVTHEGVSISNAVVTSHSVVRGTAFRSERAKSSVISATVYHVSFFVQFLDRKWAAGQSSSTRGSRGEVW